MDRVKEELYKANQRLDEIKPISSEEIEQKLTKQVKNKIPKQTFCLLFIISV
jgi:hypothetical protein